MMNRLRERMERVGASLNHLAPEEEILTAAGMMDWETVVRLVEGLDRPMNRDAWGLCLEYALQTAPVAVFEQLVDLYPNGEAAGSTVVPYGSSGQSAEVVGSLVTLAAASGKPEQLRCLLERGWDVNSASLDAAERLKRREQSMDDFNRAAIERYESLGARPESRLMVMMRMDDSPYSNLFHRAFVCMTPLAAAILCGQTECARILMDHGAWREDAPSVARALMLQEREKDAAYQVCRQAVLTHGDTPRPMALWAVVRSCSEQQLEAELRRCPYDEERIVCAVRELCNGFRPMPSRGHWAEERARDVQRLQVLERHYPQALRRPDVVSLLLRWGLLQNSDEDGLSFLLRLCPERVDLSLIREGFLRMPVRKTLAFLRQLCEGRTCVMDRDSVPTAVSPQILQLLIREVEFLPPASDRSVSGLSCAILNSGNLRLIQKALETGLIPAEEPTELLLRCQMDHPWTAAARTLLLTIPRKSGGPAGFEHRKVIHYGPMYRWMPKELSEYGYEVLAEEDCPESLERELVMRGLYDHRRAVRYETAEGRWEVESPLALLCWTGRRRVVERWVRCGSQRELREVCKLHPAGKDYTLVATPLCIAAFAGQTQVVESLLALGAEAEEQHMGLPSTLIYGGGTKSLPITPLLAAMVQGPWDVARLLLKHGAKCDLEQNVACKLWSALGRNEQLEEARQLLGQFLHEAESRASLTA